MANSKPATADANFLRDALHKARLAEAAHREAMLYLTDAQALRLQLLKDDLVPAASSVPAVEGLVDLALISGLSPRLWIDPVSSVVMEPDPRTYRFIQDTADGREIMLETADRAAMTERIKAHIAHRIVARERQFAGSATKP